MKPTKKAVVTWSMGVLILGLVLVMGYQISLYGGIVTKRHSTKDVLVVDAFPPFRFLDIHGKYPRLLIANGHRFEQLKGSFPYYLEIPQLHSILFMEGNYLGERDAFVMHLLELYEQHLPINMSALAKELNLTEPALNLWISIMQAENVLNPVQGKPGMFSLFRTHHTVNLVAEARSRT